MKTGIVLCFLFVRVAFASPDPVLPRLPELYVFQYSPPKRDPFISATAKRTLVSTEMSAPSNTISGSAVQQYLQTITAAIKQELFVGGISIGDGQSPSMAIINGVSFAQGSKIPLPIQVQQLQQLQALARTYGLPLESNQTQRDSIFVEVGKIKVTSVSIVLPGFKTSLCDLPYVGDLISQPVQLERKHP